jgi:hypothetical protein
MRRLIAFGERSFFWIVLGGVLTIVSIAFVVGLLTGAHLGRDKSAAVSTSTPVATVAGSAFSELRAEIAKLNDQLVFERYLHRTAVASLTMRIAEGDRV